MNTQSDTDHKRNRGGSIDQTSVMYMANDRFEKQLIQQKLDEIEIERVKDIRDRNAV